MAYRWFYFNFNFIFVYDIGYDDLRACFQPSQSLTKGTILTYQDIVEATNGTLCHIQGWQMRKHRHRNRGQEGQPPPPPHTHTHNFEIHGGTPNGSHQSNKPRLIKVCLPHPPPTHPQHTHTQPQYWEPSYARGKLLPSVAYQSRRSQYFFSDRHTRLIEVGTGTMSDIPVWQR